MPDLQAPQPRLARPAATAPAGAATAGTARRSLRRLDSRGVHEEPEQTTAPAAAEEERDAEPEEGFGRQWQPRLYLRIIILGLLVGVLLSQLYRRGRRRD